MNRKYIDGRPGRGVRANIYKLLNHAKPAIIQTAYPSALINQLIEAYAFNNAVSKVRCYEYAKTWIEENEIIVEDE